MTKGYTGRHRHTTVHPIGADYSPLTPADRQNLAPHYYADRHLPAGPDDRTGLLDPAAIAAHRVTATAPVPVGARSKVVAELRDALTTPPAVLASLEAWAAAGYPVEDTTTREVTS